MNRIVVRPAIRPDAAVIHALHVGASRAAGLQAPPGAMAGAPALAQEAHWSAAIAHAEPQLLVACDEGHRVIGVAGFDRCRDRGTPPTMGEIWTLQVAPAQWGRGAGLALWDGAREGLLDEGCTEVSVWVELGAHRALRFFELAGFKRVMSSARTASVSAVRVEQIRLRRKL